MRLDFKFKVYYIISQNDNTHIMTTRDNQDNMKSGKAQKDNTIIIIIIRFMPTYIMSHFYYLCTYIYIYVIYI